MVFSEEEEDDDDIGRHGCQMCTAEATLGFDGLEAARSAAAAVRRMARGISSVVGGRLCVSSEQEVV